MALIYCMKFVGVNKSNIDEIIIPGYVWYQTFYCTRFDYNMFNSQLTGHLYFGL